MRRDVLQAPEIIARQMFALGVRSYTSTVFTLLPEVAARYYRSLVAHDDAAVDRVLGDFNLPLAALRSRRRGYAVAIVKAGLRAVGRSGAAAAGGARGRGGTRASCRRR